MEFHTSRLLIDRVTLDYLPEIHQLHSLPETDEFNTSGIPENLEITKSLILDWISKRKNQPDMAYVFCIKNKDSNEFIGLIGLKIGKPNYQLGEVWYKIFPIHWNKGFTTEALQQILSFGFHTLKLHRIEAGCAVENLASIRVLEKAGMTREGRKKQLLPIRGNWVDNYFYAILDMEFQRHL